MTTFTQLLAACATHPHSRLADCVACQGRLRQAVDLYRGDFLAGFGVDDSAAFEEWRRMTQERLHLQVLDALTRLIVAAEASGGYEQMRQDLLRQLVLEPWREEAHCQLMRVLAKTLSLRLRFTTGARCPRLSTCWGVRRRSRK